jgi:hypothetical protein
VLLRCPLVDAERLYPFCLASLTPECIALDPAWGTALSLDGMRLDGDPVDETRILLTGVTHVRVLDTDERGAYLASLAQAMPNAEVGRVNAWGRETSRSVHCPPGRTRHPRC